MFSGIIAQQGSIKSEDASYTGPLDLVPGQCLPMVREQCPHTTG